MVSCEVAVLIFQRRKPLGLLDTCLMLRQDGGDLFSGKSTAFHVPALCPGESELQTGLSRSGSVAG